MSFATWFLFFITETALSFVPGPAVLFVVGTGLRHGLRASIGANLGVLSGNTTYFIASALGLGLVIAKAAPVFVVLKWLGAAYLVWLGIQSLRAAPPLVASTPGVASEDAAPSTDDASAAPGTSAPAAIPAPRARLTPFVAWRTALLLQLGNPKAILFFTALVPQFVHPESRMSVPLQILILGVTSVVSEFFVLLGYGALAAHAAAATRDSTLLVRFERASGVCLLGCAALALAA